MLVLALALVRASDASPAAEKLFQDGRNFMTEGKLVEACDAFRRSNELEARVGTLLNLANCEEKRGRIATAWSTFVEARALAKRLGDDRAAEADKRAATLAPKLPYLTVKVAHPLPDLVVRRNGIEVPAAELEHEVPLDPGAYDIDASATGHQGFKQSVELAAGSHVTVAVPPLVAVAGAAEAAAAPLVDKPGAPAPSTPVAPAASWKQRQFGIGIASGVSSDKDVIGGLRGFVGIAEAGPGMVRLVSSVFYTRSHDAMDVYQYYDIFAIGLATEYVWPETGRLFFATGLGFGIDLIKDAYNNPLNTHVWAAGRVSPTLRIGRFDLGLHIQIVAGTGGVVGLGELGIDYVF